MTRKSTAQRRAWSFRRIAIALSLLVLLLGTILAIANTSWGHRIASDVAEMAPTLSQMAHKVAHEARIEYLAHILHESWKHVPKK